MMPAACRLLAATIVFAGLSGCDRGTEERAQAAGEILEGTISDSMLKTDQVRSEAPLAPRKAGAGNKVGGSNAKSGPASEPGDDAPAPNEEPAAPEPAVTPQPAPTPAET
ncbi:MAG: hypothetical protein LC648_02545 [Novosphingobium sp.]|nr:hypothetical protein [Novosphingobium sp.]